MSYTDAYAGGATQPGEERDRTRRRAASTPDEQRGKRHGEKDDVDRRGAPFAGVRERERGDRGDAHAEPDGYAEHEGYAQHEGYAEHEGYADDAGYDHEDPLLVAPTGRGGRGGGVDAHGGAGAGERSPDERYADANDLGAGAGADAISEVAVSRFNASEAAGRIAGIARALGEPEVSVRPLEHDRRRISIVVAWELCWYRYEVDIGAESPLVALAGDGTELHELSPEDRLANARADERGELSLI